MKNSFYFFALLMIIASLGVQAQDCIVYFPITEGSIFEITYFSSKGKVESRSVSEILEKNTSNGSLTILARLTSYSKNDKDTVQMEYSAGCTNGVFQINMFPGAGSGQQGMIELDGDFLDIPSDPKAGQLLDDKTIIVKIAPSEETGEALINLKYHFVNRKIEAIESIETKAGIFNTVKISYDLNTRFVLPIKMHIVEWYAENIGQVRSETYKKGKLKGYSELTYINN